MWSGVSGEDGGLRWDILYGLEMKPEKSALKCISEISV